MDALCNVQLLGRLCVDYGEKSITRFRDSKAASLFAYLVYYRGRPHPRETLAYLFWPDSDEGAGRACLSTALHALHKQFEAIGAPKGTVFFADRAAIQCNPEAVATDVSAFESGLNHSSRAEQPAEVLRLLLAATARYSGELLPGYYDDWVLTERIRLQTLYLGALVKIVAAYEAASEPQKAIQYAQKIVAADPLYEEAHEILIRIYASLGDTDAARRQYRSLAKILEKETGSSPDPTLSRYWQQAKKEPPAAPILRPARQETALPLPSPTPDEERVISSAQRLKAKKEEELEARQENRPAAKPARLPLRLTRFFGRETEMAALQNLLTAPDIRLVTLTGSGGNGKTRLATEVAEKLLPEWNGNIWFAPLADIAEPRQIAAALRDTLGLPRDIAADPLEQIVAALQDTPALLVLDNFEQLLHDDDSAGSDLIGVEIVRALLRDIPRLTCFVTSRAALDISGEREFALSPLPVPQMTRPAPAPFSAQEDSFSYSAQDTARNPEENSPIPPASVQMFIDRMKSARPDFQLTPGNALTIDTLCARLEGIPLALELAAARAQVMTPAQMLRQLEAPFDFLSTRRRDVAPRHQTIFKAIDWSFCHLAPPLRDFFTRLSVFRGGFTLEAAEAVCGAKTGNREEDNTQGAIQNPGNASPPPAPPSQGGENLPQPLLHKEGRTLAPPLCKGGGREGVPAPPPSQGGGREGVNTVEELEQLRHLSLVLAEERGEEMRFRLLELLRAFGETQLSPKESDALQRGHALYFLQFAETAWTQLRGPQQADWLEKLDAEMDNFRAAWRWAAQQGEAEIAVRLCSALGLFCDIRGHVREYGEWVTAALALPNKKARTVAYANVLYWHGVFVSLREGSRKELPHLEQALSIYRELNDIPGVIEILFTIGNAYVNYEMEGAESLYAEASGLARQCGEQRLVAYSLLHLALLAKRKGDLPAARSLAQERLVYCRQLAGERSLATALQLLASVETNAEARQNHYAEALLLYEGLGDNWGRAIVLYSLGYDLGFAGEYAKALPYLENALALFRDLGLQTACIPALDALAEVHFHSGAADSALALADEGIRLARATNDPKLHLLLPTRARILLRQGATADAIACLREVQPAAWSLRTMVDAEYGYVAASPHSYLLTGIGILLRENRALPDAARLLGAVAAESEARPHLFGHACRLEFEAYQKQAAAALPPAKFTANWNAGHALFREGACPSLTVLWESPQVSGC